MRLGFSFPASSSFHGEARPSLPSSAPPLWWVREPPQGSAPQNSPLYYQQGSPACPALHPGCCISITNFLLQAVSHLPQALEKDLVTPEEKEKRQRGPNRLPRGPFLLPPGKAEHEGNT